jgi:hypothetical protein
MYTYVYQETYSLQSFRPECVPVFISRMRVTSPTYRILPLLPLPLGPYVLLRRVLSNVTIPHSFTGVRFYATLLQHNRANIWRRNERQVGLLFCSPEQLYYLCVNEEVDAVVTYCMIVSQHVPEETKRKKQEVLGRTNRLLSSIRHGPHWKRRVQQFFYFCVCIRYRCNVSTEPLPSNDRGIFTEPLPNNDRGIFTHPLPSNDTGCTSNTQTYTAT